MILNAIIQLIQSSENLHFKGFLAHAGHTYQASSVNEVMDIGRSSIAQLNKLKKKFIRDFPQLIISYGDTPSCSVLEDFSGVDEIRPGNFVYYDVMQLHLGSCTFEQIAVAVACPVVAIHSERNELVVYGGAVHLSKEYIPDKNGLQKLWTGCKHCKKMDGANQFRVRMFVHFLRSMGLYICPNLFISNFKPGDVIGILPVHSCLTANLLKDDTYLL